MRGGFFQRIHDSVKMILWVRLKIGIPNCLFAEHDLSVDDRGGLSIAAAEVETYATAFEVTSERRRAVAFCGKFTGMNDFERMIEHALRDNIRIEFSSCCVAIVGGEFCGQGRGTLEMNAKTTAGP